MDPSREKKTKRRKSKGCVRQEVKNAIFWKHVFIGEQRPGEAALKRGHGLLHLEAGEPRSETLCSPDRAFFCSMVSSPTDFRVFMTGERLGMCLPIR